MENRVFQAPTRTSLDRVQIQFGAVAPTASCINGRCRFSRRQCSDCSRTHQAQKENEEDEVKPWRLGCVEFTLKAKFIGRSGAQTLIEKSEGEYPNFWDMSTGCHFWNIQTSKRLRPQQTALNYTRKASANTGNTVNSSASWRCSHQARNQVHVSQSIWIHLTLSVPSGSNLGLQNIQPIGPSWPAGSPTSLAICAHSRPSWRGKRLWLWKRDD